jgi:DNA-binding NarL/FixJ family response regulator
MAVLHTASPQEAEILLKKTPGKFALLLTHHDDIKAEEQLLEHAAEIDPRTVRMVIGHDSMDTERTLSALRQGAYGGLDIDSPVPEIRSTLRSALKYRDLLRENFDYRHYLESMIRQKTREVRDTPQTGGTDPG